MNLLFCINHNVLGEFGSCLKSIVLHGGFTHYDVYVLHSALEASTCEAIRTDFGKDMTFHFISVPDVLFSGFPVTDRYPKEIYYRLAAPQLLPEQLERILYLDVDTLVINSLQELYETDFQGNYYAGCTHTKGFLTKVNQSRLNADKKSAYINTGVLLMNLPVLRKKLNLNEIREYVQDNEKALILPDQDILSALYGNKVLLLDTLRFNLSDRIMNMHNAEHWHHKIDTDWVAKNTSVIHYCGTNKPWNRDYMGKLGVFYHELLPNKLTSSKFQK